MRILPRGPELADLRLGEEQVIEGLAVALTVVALVFGLYFTAAIGGAVTIAIVLMLGLGHSDDSR